MAEVYEVATFYAHFDIVKEGQSAPPAITIRVCNSLSCEMAGATALHKALRVVADPGQIRVVHAPCMGLCDKAPAVAVGHNYFGPVTPEVALQTANGGKLKRRLRTTGSRNVPASGRLQAPGSLPDRQTYTRQHIQTAHGRWFARARRRWLPHRSKMGFCARLPGPRYVAINVDEGEPGTFKTATIWSAIRIA